MANANCTSLSDIGVKPIIGILCIDVAKGLLEMFPELDIRSYIAASYVKFLKEAGAEVVPIWIGRDHSFYEDLLKKLNGVLIPGGAVYLTSQPGCDLPNDCVQSSKYIYEISKRLNNEGIYLPILGTCLGFQLLLYHAACDEEIRNPRESCERMNCSLPIRFQTEFRSSKMFSNLNEDMEKLMKVEPFGFHVHQYCITRESLNHLGLLKEWHILAFNEDPKGKEFITFIEHKKYPFYGSQVHLERVKHEILEVDSDNCDHSQASIDLVNYFSTFFISECRRNSNHFDAGVEGVGYSFEKFKPTWTKIGQRPHWLECYLFPAHPKYEIEETKDSEEGK